MTAIAAHILENLGGQFPGWRQDQGAAGFRMCALIVLNQSIEDRQHKGRRLAGTGLGDADNVPASNHRGNHFALDRGRRFIAFIGQGAENGLGQAEISKLGQKSISFLGIGRRNSDQPDPFGFCVAEACVDQLPIDWCRTWHRGGNDQYAPDHRRTVSPTPAVAATWLPTRGRS